MSHPRSVGNRRFVVVSGLPGSGKSTLGHELAPRLGLALLDKDDFLEGLLDGHAAVDAQLRHALSRQSDRDFQRAAEASSGAVLVSFWRREDLSSTSGTPTDWLGLPNVVEMHCACSPTVAATRFVARQRHTGHGDARRSADELARQFAAPMPDTSRATSTTARARSLDDFGRFADAGVTCSGFSMYRLE